MMDWGLLRTGRVGRTSRTGRTGRAGTENKERNTARRLHDWYLTSFQEQIEKIVKAFVSFEWENTFPTSR